MEARKKDIHVLLPELSDLEVAALICLVADQHCIVRARVDDLEAVERQIQSFSRSTFGFSCATVMCSQRTTLEDISNGVLEEPVKENNRELEPASSLQFRSARSRSPLPTNTLDERKTCNVVVARNLDQAERNVQVQALEVPRRTFRKATAYSRVVIAKSSQKLMRSRRIYSRTTVHPTPKRFLFIALLSDSIPGPPLLNPHLNDHFFMSHLHMNESSGESSQNSLRSPSIGSMNSTSSILRHPSPLFQMRPSFTSQSTFQNINPPVTEEVLNYLTQLLCTVLPSATILRHLHDIPTHLRLHRHVSGGVSAVSTRHLNQLAKVLAVLSLPPGTSNAAHSTYERAVSEPVITPTLCVLAAEKIYPHRVEIVQKAENERSMQWGSDYEAVEESLKQASMERCFEDIFGNLPVPV